MKTTRHHHRIRNVACACALSAMSAGAAVAQSSLDEEFVVIKAGKVITVSGDEIDQGMIVIVDGKIRLVGKQLEYPASATVIDASDQVVMPGLIHVHTRAGLPFYSRSGVQTHRSVTEEVYLDELDFESLLRDGFTAACIIPPGSDMPGMSAVYRTASAASGKEADEVRLLNHEAFLRVSFENSGSHKPALRGALKRAQSEIDKVEKARKEWEEKQKKEAEAKQKGEEQKKEEHPKPEEGKNSNDEDEEKKPAEEKPAEEKPAEFKPPPMDPAHKRLANLLQEQAEYPLLLELRDASGVLHAAEIVDEYEQIEWVWYLQTGFREDFEYVAEALGERGARVLVVPTMRDIANTYDAYNLVADLKRRGCEVAFVPAATRLYRNQIAQLVRSGLPREAAIESMTLEPARLLRIDDRLGTIEKDKDADLIFLDGDPIDPASSVKRVMILGETVWQHEEDDA